MPNEEGTPKHLSGSKSGRLNNKQVAKVLPEWKIEEALA